MQQPIIDDAQTNNNTMIPKDLQSNVLSQSSQSFADAHPFIEGYRFDHESVSKKGKEKGHEDDAEINIAVEEAKEFECDYERIIDKMITTGFQATALGMCIEEVNRMLRWRLTAEEGDGLGLSAAEREETRCKIFCGFTSNLTSSGVRESLCYLARNRMIDVFCTTAGGVEEDFIKCLARTYVGSFEMVGSELRKKGLNRIGNLLVPNDNYCKFEDWLMPILDKMLKEQEDFGVHWTPSSFIKRLGVEINDETSVFYWCAKNDIPVYCPALTDGSIGDMLYFHSFKNPGLIIDLVRDIKNCNDEAFLVKQPKKTGLIILGGGVAKHHMANANLMRNGADFAVYMSTANEFDGSDSGARPDEAVSWGKITLEAKPVKCYCDATIGFPLLVARSFAKKNGDWVPKK
jgi:deoxyhypusine synthase